VRLVLTKQGAALTSDLGNLITLDMGGTSTDCALIIDGSPAIRRETAVDSLTVRAPSVDVQ
jgi:5-oxoprolinase (ATP-hydrolysing)